MMSATSLPIAFKPYCDQSCHNMHPTAGLALLWECGNLNPPASTAQGARRRRLTGRPAARLQATEDLLGALVSGGYNSSRRSIESRAQMSAGFRHAILFQ